MLIQQGLHVSGENAARRELVAITRFREERLASQSLCGALDGFLERQVLERVQRVVVDEDADGSLRRQQGRQLIDHGRESIVLRARTVQHRA